jgi:tetratricopeptide (TPR) repeat protein
MSNSSNSVPSRDDVVRDVLRIRDAATEGIAEWDYQRRRLRQALRNRQGRFALLFAVCNDHTIQRQITHEVFSELPGLEPVELFLRASEDSVLAALMDAAGAPAPLVVYGIETMLPSSELRATRREDTLRELQYRRELFRALDRPVVLWMPEYVFVMIGHQAVDFWSWQSGTFFFTRQTPPSRESEIRQSSGAIDATSTGPELVGREYELTAMLEALAEGRHVVLSGAGGVGKTSLAQIAARRCRGEFPGGTFFVSLHETDQSSNTAAKLLADVIHQIAPEAVLPASVEALRAVYDDVLHGRRALVIVDDVPNSETARLLVPPPPSQLVVTSRAHIPLRDAVQIGVDTLTLDASLTLIRTRLPDLSTDDAVELAVWSRGSPLVLQMVGGLLVSDPTIRITDIIGSSPTLPEQRIQTLLEHVYDRFSPDAGGLLRTLPLFSSGFDLKAAESVSGKATAESMMLLVKLGLVAKVPPDRFYVHPAVRQFLASKLNPEELNDVSFRHATYYATVLSDVERIYLGHTSEPASVGISIFETEWPNIRQGHDWATGNASRDERTASLCIKYALEGQHILRARLSAGERLSWFEVAVMAAERLDRVEIQGMLFEELADLHRMLGATSEAERCDQRSLESYIAAVNASGDRPVLEQMRLDAALARGMIRRGDLDRATQLYRKLADTSEQIGDTSLRAEVEKQLGDIAFVQGDYEKADRRYNQALEFALSSGNTVETARVYRALGVLAWRKRELYEAEQWYLKALATASNIGDSLAIAETMYLLGQIASVQGDLEKADKWLMEGLAVTERMQDLPAQSQVLTELSSNALRRGEFDRAEWAAQRALEIAERASLHIETVMALRLLGNLCEERGDHEGALELFRRALSRLREPSDTTLADELYFSIARILSEIGQLDEAVLANLESFSRTIQLGDAAQTQPNIYLFGVQREILGSVKFNDLLRSRLKPDELESLTEAIDVLRKNMPNTKL